jgi:methyltransferase (TIGR00027 family)
MNVSHPVARTAFYCCVIRAADAASPRPVCGDTFANRFLDDTIKQDIAPLLRFSRPAAGNVVRHRLVDDLVREYLQRLPNGRIIVLGAGFDTRAYRMTGGRWFELDDPQLLAFKEQRLPLMEAPNPLTRIPVTFQNESPDQYLGALAGDDEVLVILEGVSMYLSDETLERLAAAVARAFPRATLVCDLMSQMFARTFSRGLKRALQQMGATFGARRRHPRHAIERAGFTLQHRTSIPVESFKRQGTQMPSWLLATLLRTLRDGYMVHVYRRPR